MSDHDWKKIAKIVLVLIVAFVLYTLLFKSSSSSIAPSVPTKTVAQKEPFDALNSLVDHDDREYDLTEQVNGQFGLYEPLHSYELSFDDKASVSDSQLILEQVVTSPPPQQPESQPVVPLVVGNAVLTSVPSASSVVARVNSSVGSSVDSVNAYINENQEKISNSLSNLFNNVKSSLSS